MSDELVARLRRKEQRYPVQGGGAIGTKADGKVTSTSYITDDGYRLVNPDGPEAADTIANLQQRVKMLEEVLQDIAGAIRIGLETDVLALANLARACQETARAALQSSTTGKARADRHRPCFSTPPPEHPHDR